MSTLLQFECTLLPTNIFTYFFCCLIMRTLLVPVNMKLNDAIKNLKTGLKVFSGDLVVGIFSLFLDEAFQRPIQGLS